MNVSCVNALVREAFLVCWTSIQLVYAGRYSDSKHNIKVTRWLVFSNTDNFHFRAPSRHPKYLTHHYWGSRFPTISIPNLHSEPQTRAMSSSWPFSRFLKTKNWGFRFSQVTVTIKPWIPHRWCEEAELYWILACLSICLRFSMWYTKARPHARILAFGWGSGNNALLHLMCICCTATSEAELGSTSIRNRDIKWTPAFYCCAIEVDGVIIVVTLSAWWPTTKVTMYQAICLLTQEAWLQLNIVSRRKLIDDQ